MTYAHDDVTYAYDDETYAYDDVTYVYRPLARLGVNLMHDESVRVCGSVSV